MRTTKKKSSYTQDYLPQEEIKPVSTISPYVIIDNVLKELGTPPNLCQLSSSLTRATPVTQNSFRVQIYCYKEDCVVLTDTFFVHVDDEGNIVKSYPTIAKKY